MAVRCCGRSGGRELRGCALPSNLTVVALRGSISFYRSKWSNASPKSSRLEGGDKRGQSAGGIAAYSSVRAEENQGGASGN